MSKPRLLEDITADMLLELDKAVKEFGAFNSAHEGIAIIKEEYDELWDEIKKRDWNKADMREEAIQLGAMAIRFVFDIIQE